MDRLSKLLWDLPRVFSRSWYSGRPGAGQAGPGGGGGVVSGSRGSPGYILHTRRLTVYNHRTQQTGAGTGGPVRGKSTGHGNFPILLINFLRVNNTCLLQRVLTGPRAVQRVRYSEM